MSEQRNAIKAVLIWIAIIVALVATHDWRIEASAGWPAGTLQEEPVE